MTFGASFNQIDFMFKAYRDKGHVPNEPMEMIFRHTLWAIPSISIKVDQPKANDTKTFLY
jgi:hypothetical protein